MVSNIENDGVPAWVVGLSTWLAALLLLSVVVLAVAYRDLFRNVEFVTYSVNIPPQLAKDYQWNNTEVNKARKPIPEV